MRLAFVLPFLAVHSLSFAAEIIAGQPLPQRVAQFVTPTGQTINQYVPTSRANSVFGPMVTSTTAPGNNSVGFGRGGSPVAFAGDPRLSVQGGNVVGKRAGVLTLPGGAKLPVDAAAKITGRAMAPILGKALKLLPFIGTGVALYDLGKELGVEIGKDANGNPTFKGDAGVSYVVDNPVCTENHGRFPTPEAACAFLAQGYVDCGNSVNHPTVPYTLASYSVSTENVCLYFYDQGLIGHSNAVPLIIESGTGNTSIHDRQEFEDAIAEKSGWPPSSVIAKALADAQNITGDTIPTEGPDITGPSSVTGPKEVSNKPIPNGSKETTKQSNYDCTYYDGPTVMDGGSVACTERTTTSEKDTVIDPVTQETTTTTTQTEEVIKPAEVTGNKSGDSSSSDLDPCDVDPERAGCVHIGSVPDPDVMKKTTMDVTVVAAAFTEAAGCPSGVTFSAFGHTYTFGYQPLCDFMSKIRTLVLMLGGVAAAFIFANSFKV